MGLGDSLKKWAQSKATEMLTADGGKREGAAAVGRRGGAAGQERRRARQLLRTAFPKVGEMADKQEADKAAREQAEEQERRDEIASLPSGDRAALGDRPRHRPVVGPAALGAERHLAQ